MIQLGDILNSDKELDVPDLTNESNSIGNDIKCSAETGESCEALKPAISTDRHIDPPCNGVRSACVPFITRSSYIIGSKEQLKKVGSIAKKISEIIVDRPVNYRWMFSTDVAISREAPPSSEEGKVLYYLFIKHIERNCSNDLVKYFCDKLYNLISDENTKIKYFLALFWKRVESEIENKLYLYPGNDAVLEGILALLEEDDIQCCVEKLLTITTSTKDFQFLFTGLSYSELTNKQYPLTDPEKVLLKLLQLLAISSPGKKVPQFYDKLIDATRQEERFEYVKKRLIFFWKRILSVIETKFKPGEAELSERLLTEMTNILNETFDREKLSDIVTRIIKAEDTLEYSTRIFQKKVSLAETTDNDDCRSVFCKFIHRLQLSQGEETVRQFCDELHQEVSKEKVPKVTRKRLMIFWSRVVDLIMFKFPSLEAESNENMLNEMRKTMMDTFKESSLLISVIKEIVQTLETSKRLGGSSRIFFPFVKIRRDLMNDELIIRSTYINFFKLLKEDFCEQRVKKFQSLLYESINKVTSGVVWKFCIIFWNRVLCVVEQVSGQENNDVESQLLDTLEEILKDTFGGEDISNLCEKILKNMEGCRNRQSLQQLFKSDVMIHKPPSEEKNRLDYYKFIQRLKFTNSKENVQSFCDQLYDNISKEENRGILHTLVLIFWIRVQCLIKDEFYPIKFDFDRNLFPEIIKIMKETFAGDNCLTKYSASHASCNCFCIQCATWLHEWYYKIFYKNSTWLRRHHPMIVIVDNVCYIICFIISLVLAILAIIYLLKNFFS